MKQITNGCFNFNATTVIYVWTYDLVDDLKQVAVFWSIFLFQVQTLPLVPMNFNTLLMRTLPSRQILVPRTSRGCPLPTSPVHPLKILFDVLKWRPWDFLIWRSGVPGRLILDVPRTFSGCQDFSYRTFKACFRDDVWSSFGCPIISFCFSFGTYLIVQIYL